jgi:heptaprenyl diphosphate synthase
VAETMMQQKQGWKKTAYLGIFLALAMICSYIETLIPFNFGIPGVKLGLTNIVVVLMLYCVGAKESLMVSVVRIILVGILFGNLISILYSLSGGLLSFLVMALLKKTNRLGCISVSVAGGISHNIGQILVAAVIVSNFNVLFYIPVLLLAGVVTGVLIGILSQELIVRLSAIMPKSFGKENHFHEDNIGKG